VQFPYLHGHALIAFFLPFTQTSLFPCTSPLLAISMQAFAGYCHFSFLRTARLFISDSPPEQRPRPSNRDNYVSFHFPPQLDLQHGAPLDQFQVRLLPYVTKLIYHFFFFLWVSIYPPFLLETTPFPGFGVRFSYAFFSLVFSFFPALLGNFVFSRERLVSVLPLGAASLGFSTSFSSRRCFSVFPPRTFSKAVGTASDAYFLARGLNFLVPSGTVKEGFFLSWEYGQSAGFMFKSLIVERPRSGLCSLPPPSL